MSKNVLNMKIGKDAVAVDANETEDERIQRLADEKYKQTLDVHVSLSYCITNPEPVKDFVLSGLKLGNVGCFYAPGASSKSYFSLQRCMSIAIGRDINGFDESVKQGRAIYFSTEDDKAELHSRLNAIGKAYSLSEDELRMLDANVVLLDFTGFETSNILCAIDAQVIEKIISEEKQKANSVNLDVRLVVFDTLSQFHLVDENLNKEMKPVVRRFKLLSRKFNVAIIYVHHCNKSSAVDGSSKQQAARGASCIIDDARWGGYLRRLELFNKHGKLAEDAKMLRLSSSDSELDFADAKVLEHMSQLIVFGDGKVNSSKAREIVLCRNDRGVLVRSMYQFVSEQKKFSINSSTLVAFQLEESEELRAAEKSKKQKQGSGKL